MLMEGGFETDVAKLTDHCQQQREQFGSYGMPDDLAEAPSLVQIEHMCRRLKRGKAAGPDLLTPPTPQVWQFKGGLLVAACKGKGDPKRFAQEPLVGITCRTCIPIGLQAEADWALPQAREADAK